VSLSVLAIGVPFVALGETGWTEPTRKVSYAY
jgi:hypothetical protein